MRFTKFKLSVAPAVELTLDFLEMEFVSYEQLKMTAKALANMLLFLHEKGAMRDYSNIFIKEGYNDDEGWVEISPDED